MLYRGIVGVCCGIHAEHVTILCGQNVEPLNVN